MDNMDRYNEIIGEDGDALGRQGIHWSVAAQHGSLLRSLVHGIVEAALHRLHFFLLFARHVDKG